MSSFKHFFPGTITNKKLCIEYSQHFYMITPFRDEEKSEFEGFIKDRDLVKGETRIWTQKVYLEYVLLFGV